MFLKTAPADVQLFRSVVVSVLGWGLALAAGAPPAPPGAPPSLVPGTGAGEVAAGGESMDGWGDEAVAGEAAEVLSGVASWLAGGEPSEIPAIRARYGKDAILLGVLAREEKIFSLLYLGAVANILENCPKAVFLWSGRSEHPGIRKFFADRGLNDRTPHIGWVNTASTPSRPSCRRAV